MKPAFAKAIEDNSLEELGRATAQIVHDLKNQLNGLKLYATFLRKRLERDDRSPEERETVVKLIAGLDRAARDMTVLVRYAQPIELRTQRRIDLKKIIAQAVQEASTRLSTGAGPASLTIEIENGPFDGEIDPDAMSEALITITEQAAQSVPPSSAGRVSVHAGRVTTSPSPEALIEWRGAKLGNRPDSSRSFGGNDNIHLALAAKIIKAHGGRVEYAPNKFCVWLPLSG